MNQLPLELLQLICALLDDEDLYTVATLYRYLHFASLDELFDRNKTFIPTPVSLLPHVPGRFYAAAQPTPGVCISMKTSNTSIVRGLRLALPPLFYGRSITALISTFHQPSSLERDLKGLTRFLVTRPEASKIEAVVVDFGPARLTDQEPKALPDFLRIFSEERKSKLPKCISLTVLGGATDGAYSDDIYSHNAPLVHRHGMVSTAIQILVASAVGVVDPRRIVKFKPSPGLHHLNLDTYFISHLSAVNPHWSVELFARNYTSLRSLSISKWSILWSDILAHTTLPNLEALYFNDSLIPIPHLADFLARHRNLKVLDTGATVQMFGICWSPPPSFLRSITHFATWPRLLRSVMGLGQGFRPLPNLEDLTLSLDVEGLFPFTNDFMLSDCSGLHPYTMKRLKEIRLGLRIHIKKAYTNWVKESYQGNGRANQVAIYNQLKSLQINLERFPGFLENEDILAHFAGWLKQFPVIESVEVWQCHPTDEGNSPSRKGLAHLAQVTNPSLKTFCVDTVHLL